MVELGSLGRVSSRDSVGIRVGSDLPWRVGLGEVDVDAQLPGEFVVLGHFLALVPGDGDDVAGPHSSGDGGHVVGAAPRGDLDVDSDSGDSFDEGDDRGPAALADDVRVGPGRGVGVSPEPFPRPALRTRRATLIAAGAPRIDVSCRNRGSCGAGPGCEDVARAPSVASDGYR